jgi:chemotaxis protein MotB
MAEEYASYKTKCEANEEKLIALREMLKDEADNLEKVREKIQEAMADFENRGVDIYTKDGLIYVSLAEELLYKSGSAKLGNSGKEALGTLASVLNDYPKLKVIVVGNTDTVRVKGVADNWSLSTERANGVVRILAKDYSVDPSRLTAAGKGKFNPVADNTSAEGRAKNRRTDIILNPDLERIWQSVKE